jgi:hypothetical protein
MVRLSNVRPVLLAFAGFTPRFELRAFEPSGLRAFGPSSLQAFEPSSFEPSSFELRASSFELRASSLRASSLRASSLRASGLRAFGPSGLRAFEPSSLRAFKLRARRVRINSRCLRCAIKIENKVSRCSFFRLSYIRSEKSELLMKL